MVAALYFFFNDTATTEIYTLSLHDALPISFGRSRSRPPAPYPTAVAIIAGCPAWRCCRSCTTRSEEHTSELQSRQYLVCRLLLEKKKKQPAVRHPVRYRPHSLRDASADALL